MPDETTPHGREPELRSRTGEIIQQTDKAIRNIVNTTNEQWSKLIVTTVMGTVLIGFAALLWWSKNDSHDQLAMVLRAGEAETERGRSESREVRSYFSQEREKDRLHYDQAVERTNVFFGAQRELDRTAILSLHTSVQMMSQNLDKLMVELAAWRKVFRDLKKDGGLEPIEQEPNNPRP